MRFVAFYTDPYLNLFRRFIPPIGGVLDLSPLLGFFALQIMENLILFILL
jgi:YggT family protein